MAIGTTAMAVIMIGAAVASAAAAAAQAQAQAKAQRNQAKMLQQAAQRRREIAAQDAESFRRQQSRLQATQRAGQAASGVQIFEGTPLGVQADTAREAEFQAERILVGGLTEAAGLSTQAGFTKAAAQNTQTAGAIKAGTTLLSGFARAGSFGSGGTATVPTVPATQTGPGGMLAGPV